MKIEVDNKTVGVASSAVAAVFAAFFLMNELHIENHELEISDSLLRQRILVSESTRYAEIIKYYNELEDDRPLSLAELERKRLAEDQQCRITRTLKMNAVSDNFVEYLKDCEK